MSHQQATQAVRAGIETDEQYGAVTPALYLSSNYTFEGLGSPRKYDYSRSGNPTRDVLADCLADRIDILRKDVPNALCVFYAYLTCVCF